MNTHDLVRQLAGWRQTTAEIPYRMPDHLALVQTYIWRTWTVGMTIRD
jgi:uncharacterized protein Usg